MTKYFVGHSTDNDIRFKSSSGGIGTAIMKYLLDSGLYNMAITFLFDPKEVLYKPILIKSASEIRIHGSIYQDIDIFSFIKENLSHIHGGIVVSCPPCQVVPIKNLLQKNEIKCFVISFCCSGQMRVEGTWCYYRFLGIKKEDIINMQYRGNGWPSGIQIWQKNGTKIYRDNFTEPWSTIHRSNFYKPKRCLYCKLDTSYKSDLSLADPWLNNYLENDSIGNTLFIVNTEQGDTIIKDMALKNIVEFMPTDYNSYYQAQRPNVEKANRIRNQRRFLHILTRLMEKPWYRDYFSKTPSRMRKHIKLYQRLYDFSTWNNVNSMLVRIIKKIKFKIRYMCISPKLGSHGKHFNISGG